MNAKITALFLFLFEKKFSRTNEIMDLVRTTEKQNSVSNAVIAEFRKLIDLKI